MNRRFIFYLLTLCLLFYSCSLHTDVQPSEPVPKDRSIPDFWNYTSGDPLITATAENLHSLEVVDAFEKYVSGFGKPLWDRSITNMEQNSVIVPVVHTKYKFATAVIMGMYNNDKFSYRVLYRFWMPKELTQTENDKNVWESLFRSFDDETFHNGPGFGKGEPNGLPVIGKGKNARTEDYLQCYSGYVCTTVTVYTPDPTQPSPKNGEGTPVIARVVARTEGSTSQTTCTSTYSCVTIYETYTPSTPTNSDPSGGTIQANYGSGYGSSSVSSGNSTTSYDTQQNKNKLCGSITFNLTGNSYTAQIEGLGLTGYHKTTTQTINAILGSTCVSIPKYGLTAYQASDIFRNAFNLATDRIYLELNAKTLSADDYTVSQRLKVLILSYLSQSVAGSTFSNGPCNGNYPLNTAKYGNC